MRRMEIQVCREHGSTISILPKDARQSCNNTTTPERKRPTRSSHNSRGRRTMGTINITTGPAATVCRQHQQEIGLEVFRQLGDRFSIPVGTRSIGYLTKLLKPTFDTNNFEESFSNWEFELNRYERDNTTRLPDPVKFAIVMNETTGQLQQHLHLNAGATPTYAEVRNIIMEYYRTATAFNRLQQQQPSSSVSTNYQGGQAPVDIGALRNKGKNKGKYKGKSKWKGSHKGKGKSNKGKGYNNTSYTPYTTGKGKGKIGQGIPFKGMSNNKGFKGKRKAIQQRQSTDTRAQRTVELGYKTSTKQTTPTTTHIMMPRTSGIQQQPNYDAHWWNSDQTMTTALPQPQQQLALPAPPQNQQGMTPSLHIGAIRAAPQINYNKEIPNIQQVPEEEDLMFDSGAATHVCPVWFAAQQPTCNLHPTQTPQLRTATEDPINVYG